MTAELSTSESSRAPSDPADNRGIAKLADEQLQRNQELLDKLRGQLVMHAMQIMYMHPPTRIPLLPVSAPTSQLLPSCKRHVIAKFSQCMTSPPQILAPLTRGGNLPFRRLCAEFGAEVTMSEMSFARHLLRGDPTEKARLRIAANEACFGFQIATNNIGEGVSAGKMAAEAGAAWLDLNCGCPIYGEPSPHPASLPT